MYDIVIVKTMQHIPPIHNLPYRKHPNHDKLVQDTKTNLPNHHETMHTTPHVPIPQSMENITYSIHCREFTAYTHHTEIIV